MKKVIALFLFIQINYISAQNTLPSTGSVGIGTTNPQAILDINANGNIPVIRGNGGYIPTGLRFIDDSYTLSGQVKEWAIFKGNTWAKGLGFMRYDAVDRCITGICDVPLFLADNGNIGLGGHLSPTDKLTIATGNLNIQNGDLILFNSTNRLTGWGDRANYYLGHYPVTGSSGLDIHWYGGIKFGTSSGDVMQILQNGNVGISKSNPIEKLEVAGNVFISDPGTLTGVQVKSKVAAINSQTYAQLGWGESTMGVAGDLVIAPRTDIGCGIRFFTNNGSAIAERFKIVGNGNASLQGKFESKEIKVTTTPTADFVFEKDYNLPKLEEVEKHIKEKKHLPEIASAKVMEKEGVNVGEFQIKLLQKIEELTLYLIEQNKQLQVQKDKIEQLEKQLKNK